MVLEYFRGRTILFVISLRYRRWRREAIIRRLEISSACQIDWHARPVIQVPRQPRTPIDILLYATGYRRIVILRIFLTVLVERWKETVGLLYCHDADANFHEASATLDPPCCEFICLGRNEAVHFSVENRPFCDELEANHCAMQISPTRRNYLPQNGTSVGIEFLEQNFREKEELENRNLIGCAILPFGNEIFISAL